MFINPGILTSSRNYKKKRLSLAHTIFHFFPHKIFTRTLLTFHIKVIFKNIIHKRLKNLFFHKGYVKRFILLLLLTFNNTFNFYFSLYSHCSRTTDSYNGRVKILPDACFRAHIWHSYPKLHSVKYNINQMKTGLCQADPRIPAIPGSALEPDPSHCLLSL